MTTGQGREHRRYYTANRLGSPCPVCFLRMPKVLESVGMRIHPTCKWWKR